MPTLSGMKPGGFYDEHSSGQRSSIEILLPWIEAAAEQIRLPEEGQAITLADYGCSEGRNSMLVVDRAANVLRRRGARHPICPVFTDLATNNFNQVFRNLQQAKYLAADREGYFPLTAGGSFYGPLLPPRTVHLATTFNSVCWLDAVPAAPEFDFIIYPGAHPHRSDVSVSPEAVAAFSGQAERDLERFLECRATEMVSGARLLLALPGCDEHNWTGRGVYDLVHDAAMDLVRAGRIDRDAYKKVIMPVYFRSLSELLRPLQGKAASLAAAFEVERAECTQVPTAFVVEYESRGDLDRYVEQYVGFVQAFSEPVVRAALEPTHPATVVAEIYTRAKERLRAAPQSYTFHYVQVAVLVVRR